METWYVSLIKGVARYESDESEAYQEELAKMKYVFIKYVCI